MRHEEAIRVLTRWRERLAPLDAESYRSALESAVEDPELRSAAGALLPELTRLWGRSVDRRRAMQLLGATLAMAAVPGCSRPPDEVLVPYTVMPENIVPGIPRQHATALSRGGYAHGVIVTTHMGRPLRVDGNPLHPASLGGTDRPSQAAAVELFDPDRSRVVTRHGNVSSWHALVEAISAARQRWFTKHGDGLAILTGAVSSPTLRRQIRAVRERLPGVRWYQHEAVGREYVRSGAKLAFGRRAEPVYELTDARVIVALDGDFLGTMPGHLRYARQFADGRRVLEPHRRINRLYAAQSTATLTGAAADHALGVRPSEVERLARRLATELGLGAGLAGEPLSGTSAAWMRAAAQDLARHRGAGVVIAGDEQPPVVHAIACAINHALGNVDRTVSFIEPPLADALDDIGTLADLHTSLTEGRTEALLVLGANPAYTAPADLPFADLLERLPFALHSGLYSDETAAAVEWHVPAHHPFETWSDARAFDGTASIVQPLIRPLYESRSDHELLTLVAADDDRSAYDIVRETWRERFGQFARQWHASLANGLITGTRADALSVELAADWRQRLPEPTRTPEEGWELRFEPDHSVWDGRYANSAWLQELPRPITSITWGNAVLISPAAARELTLESDAEPLRDGDHVTVEHTGRQITAPVKLVAGLAPRTVTLTLGYGRPRAGGLGSNLGVSAYSLRTSSDPWIATNVAVRPAPGHTPLSIVQHHHDMHGRELAREMTLDDLIAGMRARHDAHRDGPPPSLYPERDRDGRYAWGMCIDLNACIGCGVCTIACAAENNIPAVGPEEVRRGHEMHWIRIDSYRTATPGAVTRIFQPVPCMHCELAPCEYVCPVEASIHDSEGLNVQVYNRCIGTRNCSQNCPYKVRRFNWFEYNYDRDRPTATPAAAMNPDVTVRSRGVMEKCTYCVQRISRARIQAKIEEREIADGDVVPACAAACPAHAIEFGDLDNAQSAVNAWRASPRHYVLLEELGTRPRTTYLAAIRNANPALEDDGEDS